ncbi:MAG: hypothetical protein H6567_10770 [Lewinellaceae bacterium]|nr:hypothetical protein [Lewinellaceae bacterium]
MIKFYCYETRRIKKYLTLGQRTRMDTSNLNKSWATDRGILPLNYYDLEVFHGKEFDNFLTFGFTAVIHKDVVEILKSEQLTGWRSNPVSIKIKKGVVNYDYEYWVITGKCGPLIAGEIGHEYHKFTDAHNVKTTHRLGVKFDMDTWDGSDFFMSTDMSGYLLMTERAKKVIESIESKNVLITPIEELKVHENYNKK